MSGSFIHVVFKNVPSGKYKIVKIGERHKIFYERSRVVRPLAQADGSHLGERTDRLGLSAAHRLDSGDHRGRHRTQTNHHHSKLSSGWCNFFRGGLFAAVLRSRHCFL